MASKDQNSAFGQSRTERAKAVRTSVERMASRVIASICGSDCLDEADKRAIVSDPTHAPLTSGEPLLRAAYRLGRGGENDVTDEEHNAISAFEASAETALRSQFTLISRAALQVASGADIDDAALDAFLRGARWLLDRIASAEIVGAVNLGRAHAILRESGPDAIVHKRVSPAACATCRATHVRPDGTPRTFKLSALRTARSISLTGRATTVDTTIGPAHPGCMCILEIAGPTASIKRIDPVALARQAEIYKAESGTRIDFQGLPIVIENAPGSVRQWRSETGRSGSTQMLYAYGYIENTVGGENEELDVFLGPSATSPYVYIVHQHRPDMGADGSWDEDKVMLGFDNIHDASRAYLIHYDDPRFMGAMSVMSLSDFKRRLPQRGGYIGGLDVAEEIPELPENEGETLLLRDDAIDTLKSLGGDMPFDGQPVNGQWTDRGVQTGGAGPSLAVVSPHTVSSANVAMGAGYKDLALDAVREKARWMIRLDPSILFMRQDTGRPVHPIHESDIAKLAADNDVDFMHDVHAFIETQARERAKAQLSGSPNVDTLKPDKTPEETIEIGVRT